MPVVKQEDFRSAIAYFVRRLDENTAPENFLHDLFGLEVGSAAWAKQRDVFVEAVRQQDAVSDQPQRTQNRGIEDVHYDPDAPFDNAPDTDWSLPANQAWVQAIRDAWQQTQIAPIPLQIGGTYIAPDAQGQRLGAGHDPSRPHARAYHYALATREHIDQALDVAQRAATRWAHTSVRTRKALLVACAEHFARYRGDLIGAMMLDGGKRVAEADPEVSEAIDFANYYARALDLADTRLANCRTGNPGSWNHG